jgi:hypothetical protein
VVAVEYQSFPNTCINQVDGFAATPTTPPSNTRLQCRSTACHMHALVAGFWGQHSLHLGVVPEQLLHLQQQYSSAEAWEVRQLAGQQ